MKTAIVHDWLISHGGAEHFLPEIYKLFPSDIYTLIYDKKFLNDSFFKDKKVYSSFLQKMPFSVKKYRHYLPLFPLAIEDFDLSSYDVILSSSHCVAKGVLRNQHQLNICYCHTPMRYAWDLYFPYLKDAKLHKGIKGRIAKLILHYIRGWDINSSNRVDEFIANSKYIADRIYKIYKRKAHVIYSPVDISYFNLCMKKENYYLTASRLVSYKKIDLIVEAFSNMPDKKLIVIGDGPEMAKIKEKAKKNVEILGFVQRDDLKTYLQKARAFIFAAIEDFGLLPVEAQACGTPVIALDKGGLKETVIKDKTGVFFDSQDVKSIIEAVKKFEEIESEFDYNFIRKHSEFFSKERFRKNYTNFVKKKYMKFKEEL